MRWIQPLLLCLICYLPYSSRSQEYSYTHYDISDGLAGSTVYCITQDKDGFIWVGTETGVSRFDGTHFRNFTTKDGLPDVEILEMFSDSRGRVWMAPFRKSVCYYYQGKIHNQENDSLLRLMHFKGNVENFAEDAAGNILIQESSALHMLGGHGRVVEFDSINNRLIAGCHAISSSLDGHFLVHEEDSVFAFADGRFTALFKIAYNLEMKSPNFTHLSPGVAVWRFSNQQGCIRSMSTGQIKFFPFNYWHYRHVSYSVLDDSVICSNESTGTTEYTLGSARTRSFLPGVEVSKTFRDDDGNTWFTTIGKGVYRLNSDEFRNVTLHQPLYDNCSVSAIKKMDQELLVGSNRNSIFHFRLPITDRPEVERLSDLERKRIVYIDTLSSRRMVYGFDFCMEIHYQQKKVWNLSINVKSACQKNDSQLLVASSVGAYLVDANQYRIVDTLWKERSTTIFFRDDTTYIGTLNGLYRKIGDHQMEFLGEKIPFLRKRIAAIVESQAGVLWIAPYDDAGIIGIKDGKVFRRIGQEQGLTSDICRVLALQHDYLWVGTDKGLNRVDLRRPEHPIVQYTANDGLGSNVINTVFVDSPMVYVGTPAGLSFFDETKVDSKSSCRLSWLDVSSSGASRIADSADLRLPYYENNIRFEYAGISYKSAGKMTYRYRLLGLDTVWKYTKETFLDYPTLPPGEYALEIAALNKFGNYSRPMALHFAVAAPFWKTTWFYIAIGVTLVSLTWLFVSMRIKAIRYRQEEERLLLRKMGEMEHMALQSQMNPHFIFNCLNSIQQYIFDQDIFAANKYITGFSKLIRATLHNSSQSFISLSSEISYLSNYLSLEKLRFKDKMDYSIVVAPDIDPETLMIPPMLIQPYVENSMRHGLRHKTKGKGAIWIQIGVSSSRLTIQIEDNGIGREKASSYKTVEHIEYQSKGMSLTAERIGLMNSLYGEGIGVEVVDLKDEAGLALGTRVTMRFPLFVDTIKKDMYDPDRLS
jgi:ligand-binding sensor domain-containing protein/two-component sensor histidine kinase